MLEGKIAIVTGSTRGIGAAIAEVFAKNGAAVVINGHLAGPHLERMADRLSQSYNVRCIAIAADVAVADEAKTLFQTVFKEFKRLDVLVNNAGILGDSLIGMIPEETIERVLQVNLAGTIRNMQSAARLMLRTGAGSIINMSSIMGLRGNIGQTVYSASKAGVIGATLSAAKELGPKNIRVNAIAPGYIDTDMIRDVDERTHGERVRSIPLGRVGTPEDVAKVALFLASDLANYVTGQVIGVDGGMVM